MERQALLATMLPALEDVARRLPARWAGNRKEAITDAGPRLPIQASSVLGQ